ncbi:hypothetical protein N7452_008114 [Penicillium brevicompactum]|uniref:6-phosphogluconate dehydrogenase NADP-binding domain-containing protein n=1 Tax=Penicillium brevicompactum TaxID=5074 RepID=A0A9W9U9X3_PENBR|nr:hypothetical protein N7452_008114 [Penicillium brevicompactum]
MSDTHEPISVLGLGHMGVGLASALLDKGYPVTVWNRTIAKAQSLVPKGAKVAESPADCVRAGTIVIISLASDEAVRSVLSGISDLSDRTVLNFTTSRPHWEIETADIVNKELNASGGPKDIFAKQEHICHVFGKALWISEDHRKICMLENASIFGFAGLCAAYFQSIALAGAAGVDVVDFTQLALMPHLKLFENLLPQMAKRDQDQNHVVTSDSVSVGALREVVASACEAAEVSGVSAHLFKELHVLLRQAAESGKGPDDMSAVIPMLRRGGNT